MPTTFITDGRGHFIGPYAEQEPLARHRGVRELRENFDAADVWVITADTDEQARAVWARIPAAERRSV